MGKSHALAIAIIATLAATGSVQSASVTLGDAANFVIFQTGNPASTGSDRAKQDGDIVISKGKITGTVAKGLGGDNKKIDISDSTISAGTTRETSVGYSVSNSTVSPPVTANADLGSASSAATAASAAALALPGQTALTVNLNGTSQTLGIANGASNVNVFDVSNFELNNAILNLVGDPDDLFIFNVTATALFKVNDSKILLGIGVDPSDVLFNVLGLASNTDVALINNSLFQGTLLTTRHVTANSNEQFLPLEGIVGAMIADGTINFQQTEIRHQAFRGLQPPSPGPEAVPLPGALALMGTVLAGGFGLGAWRRRRLQKVVV